LKSRNETIAFHFIFHYSDAIPNQAVCIAMSKPLAPDDAVPASASDLPCCKPAGRPRAADKEARLQDLLATSGRLFLQHGYGKVSLEMIAREAHVAVRTIYVKFGGKVGLLKAIIESGRERYFGNMGALETDPRPLEQVLADFSARLVELITTPNVVNLNRMVIAEAKTHPELAVAFNQGGPGLTRELLGRFFARPEIKARFRPEVPHEMLAVHLINCLIGDQLSRLLFEPGALSEEEKRKKVELGLDLFLRSTLR
jgi:TetR/AcrR family transcriptional regulator, mexJK operon transcriptional repressor